MRSIIANLTRKGSKISDQIMASEIAPEDLVKKDISEFASDEIK